MLKNEKNSYHVVARINDILSTTANVNNEEDLLILYVIFSEISMRNIIANKFLSYFLIFLFIWIIFEMTSSVLSKILYNLIIKPNVPSKNVN